jgi:hypothetical protein
MVRDLQEREEDLSSYCNFQIFLFISCFFNVNVKIFILFECYTANRSSFVGDVHCLGGVL